MLGVFSYLVEISVGIDVFKTDIGYFSYLARTMKSSGVCNSYRIYCFRFSLNFLY